MAIALAPEKLAIVKDGMWAVVNEAGRHGVRLARRRASRWAARRAPRRSSAGDHGPGGRRQVQARRTMRGSRASAPSRTRRWSSWSSSRTAATATSPPRRWPRRSSRRGSAWRRRRRDLRPCGPRRRAAPGIARAARQVSAMIGRTLPGGRRIDLVVLGCALALAALGVLFIASATTGSARSRAWPAARRSGSRWASVAMVVRDPLRLPDAAEVLLRDLLREPPAAASTCSLFGERIANVRSWIRVRQFPVPAGRAREDRDRAARRLPLRERGRRAAARVHDLQARRDRRRSRCSSSSSSPTWDSS